VFLTDTQTMQDLSDTLKMIGVTNMPPWWNTINTKSHAWAYSQIVQRLLRRGYSITLINQWDEGGQFESDLTIFRALSRAATLENLSADFINKFDRRDELLAAAVTINNVFQNPDNPSVGQTGTGFFDHTQDIFRGPTDPANPQDPDPDQVTTW
jgi:hypothetical protein